MNVVYSVSGIMILEDIDMKNFLYNSRTPNLPVYVLKFHSHY